MFKDIEEYEEYLKKKQIYSTDIEKENYFEHSSNGEIIIQNKDYSNSAIEVSNYTNCIKWILLKDKKTMALLKYPFGDIYRNLSKEQYEISLYNNILLPQIAEQMQNESAKYYIVEGNKASNNRRHLLTIDFKNPSEELIYGEEILEETDGDIKELNIQNIINHIEKYLPKEKIKSQDVESIKREFIKQSLFNRFVKQSDENNHNWGILVNTDKNRARIAPIYDLDCCCEIGTLRKHIRTTQDNSKYNMNSFIKEFGQYEWFISYVKEVLEDFDINKAIKQAKKATGIEIPEHIQNHYKNFFAEKYYELKSAYQQYIESEKKGPQDQNITR